MDRTYAITLDIGTTNSKISLFNKNDGELVERTIFKTPKSLDANGELFDFETLWEKVLAPLEDFIWKYPNEVDSIIISSVGETGTLVDEKGNIAGPMIAWYDTRSASYIEALSEKEKQRLYSITGLPAHTNYSVSKIRWLFEHCQLNQKKLTWLNLPDLIAFRLTGMMRTEYSLASRTMCYDLEQKIWSDEVLSMFHLEGKVSFPSVIESGQIAGTLLKKIGKCDFRDEDISVRIGGHDHMAGSLSVHLKQGELLNSTGTTEGLLFLEDHLQLSDEKYRSSLANGIYTKSDLYTLFSSIPTGGIAIEWFKKLFDLADNDFEKIMENVQANYLDESNDLNDSLVVIPHLNGSGAPYKNSESKGLLYGLTTETSKEDFLLGIFLGLSLELKNAAACFPLDDIDKVIVIGPANKNSIWLQLKADALNKEVLVSQMDEAVSYGALSAAYPEFHKNAQYRRFLPNRQRTSDLDHVMEKFLVFYNEKKKLG